MARRTGSVQAAPSKLPASRLPDDRLDEWTRQCQAHQASYKQLIETIQSLSSLEKAEQWLWWIAENEPYFGDQEALVYLVSRGQDCSKLIRDMLLWWKETEAEVIEEYRNGSIVWSPDNPSQERVGQHPEFRPEDIPRTYDLRDFWGGNDYQELSIDATVLRTVEWCKIGGFDGWWDRLAREHYAAVVQHGVEPLPASFYLFSMARSDYALRLMSKGMDRVLDALRLPMYHETVPWRIVRWDRKRPEAVDHFAYAASLAFSTVRIHPSEAEDPLIAQALDALLRSQTDEGGWRCWADDRNLSVDTTAMAVHALALCKPRGWEISTRAAAEWLRSKQTRDGCWADPGCPDSTYLTVLVLDALELAAGGDRVTFRPDYAEQAMPVLLTEPKRVQAKTMPRRKILFLAANPKDTLRLRLEEEIRAIELKIRSSDYRDSLELKSAWAVRADDLLELLNIHQPHIVHFSGHGVEDTGELVLLDASGHPNVVSTEALRALFETVNDNIQAVVLNSCYSIAQARAICEVVDFVVGMNASVDERAAITFAASFYRAIGFNRSVPNAFEQGKVALLLEGMRADLPQLLSRPRVRGFGPG